MCRSLCSETLQFLPDSDKWRSRIVLRHRSISTHAYLTSCVSLNDQYGCLPPVLCHCQSCVIEKSVDMSTWLVLLFNNQCTWDKYHTALQSRHNCMISIVGIDRSCVLKRWQHLRPLSHGTCYLKPKWILCCWQATLQVPLASSSDGNIQDKCLKALAGWCKFGMSLGNLAQTPLDQMVFEFLQSPTVRNLLCAISCRWRDAWGLNCFLSWILHSGLEHCASILRYCFVMHFVSSSVHALKLQSALLHAKQCKSTPCWCWSTDVRVQDIAQGTSCMMRQCFVCIKLASFYCWLPLTADLSRIGSTLTRWCWVLPWSCAVV